MICLWKWKRPSVKISSVVENQSKKKLKFNPNMFVLLVALTYGEKEGFESFDDQNLFLFTDLTGPNIFVRSLPTTDAISPSLVCE
jgi:hypothetical protein